MRERGDISFGHSISFDAAISCLASVRGGGYTVSERMFAAPMDDGERMGEVGRHDITGATG